jgi:hypothetical protein
MARTATKPKDGYISVTQAMQLLMVSDTWIRKLVKSGYIPAIENGTVQLVAAVQGYIRYLKDEERRTSKTATLSQVQQERALEIRQRREQAAGNLVELDATEEFVADTLGALRAEIFGVPAAVTRDAELRLLIEQRLNDALTRARNKFTQRSETLRSGGTISLGNEAADA